MKLNDLLSSRFREAPADCVIESHKLMMRGGYIKQVGNGIYSLYPPALRIVRKIENIIRQEMNAIDGQEVLFPVTMPASLWQESGRYASVGAELGRFNDRGGNPMVLGMTHEEAAVHLARDTAASYTQYPFMIYQIQTKFRDEPRTRGGLIRVREFTMKDGYSFHTSQEDLEAYYVRAHAAYERIFARVGVPVVSVLSDSGMMGGKISHEFMLLADIGEDTLVLCGNCDYRSNMEAADCVVEPLPADASLPLLPLQKVETPEQKTIQDLCDFLKIQPAQTAKAVVYRKNADNSLIVVMIRGDLDVNETKLRNAVGAQIHPAIAQPDDALTFGFIGPMGLPEGVALYFDASLKGASGLATGANQAAYHYTNLSMARDLPDAVFGDYAKAYAGAACPKCGQKTTQISRGIEVGNIFQLGTKYSETMGLQYTDAQGRLQTPIMGCYGIGVGRLMASLCEVSHDKYGPVWPMSVAPWQVHICAIRADDPAVRAAADALYDALQAVGAEVLYDDRAVSPGSMFSDADLLGVPLRVIVSPKTLARNAVEFTARDKSFTLDLGPETAAQAVRDKIDELLK